MPGSSPHGDYTVQADNGTGTMIDRYYSVYRPDGLTNSPTNKAPAVLVFGGSQGCGPNEIARLYRGSRLQPIADANRLIVVYMTTQTARAPLCGWHHRAIDFPITARDSLDDEAYVTAVLDDIMFKQNVDPLRIYATGASSGGAMVQAVACDPANSVRIRGIAAVSEFMPVDISGGQPTGDPMCPSSNQRLFVQLISGTADANVPYNGICIASHCLASFSATLDFWRRHLGCSAVNTVTSFGTPQADNRKQTFTNCTFGTNYGVEGLTVQGGAHYYSGLDDALNGSVNTNGFYPAQALWSFFSFGISGSPAPAAKAPSPTHLLLVRVTGTGTGRKVRTRLTVGGAATITATLRRGSSVVVTRVVRAPAAGAVSLVLSIPAKSRAGAYLMKLGVRGAGGNTLNFVRRVTVPA
jgi:polyhydroxybutyrate depolymerase